jgi:hypothetical protein
MQTEAFQWRARSYGRRKAFWNHAVEVHLQRLVFLVCRYWPCGSLRGKRRRAYKHQCGNENLGRPGMGPDEYYASRSCENRRGSFRGLEYPRMCSREKKRQTNIGVSQTSA